MIYRSRFFQTGYTTLVRSNYCISAVKTPTDAILNTFNTLMLPSPHVLFIAYPERQRDWPCEALATIVPPKSAIKLMKADVRRSVLNPAPEISGER